ncbi:MAG: hypothetical protein RIR26_561 [Pseudomonadota bacterium]|jgi:hypothetical protein
MKDVCLRLSVLIFSLGVARPAWAESSPDEPRRSAQNYISWKYGIAQSNMPYNDEAKFKNDSGTTKLVEFFWGNARLAKFLGGINLSPKNQYAGFILSAVIDDKDIISVRQFTTHDELLKSERDYGFSRGLGFGKKKASTTEYSWIFSHQGSDFWNVTYGESNYPAMVYVSQEPFEGDEKSFFDPNPEFQYLHFGFELDPVRAALLSGREVSDYAMDWIYLVAKLGFGVYFYDLSNEQYSSHYENPDDKYGLKYQSGYAPAMAGNYELGLHGSFHSDFLRAVGTIGYYYQMAPNSAITALYKFSESATGYYFRADGSPHHGVIGRMAVTF